MTVPTSCGATPGMREHRARRLDAEIDRRNRRQRAVVVGERRAHAVEQPDVAPARGEPGRDVRHVQAPWSITITRADGSARVELVHQLGAAAEHRALVDRALVGHFAGVERGRLAQQNGAADAVRAAGAAAGESGEPGAQFIEHAGVGGDVFRVRGGEPPAGVEIREDQRADLVAVGAGDDDVARIRRELRQQARAQRADIDPGAGRELEVLGDAAVEQQALARIARGRRI